MEQGRQRHCRPAERRSRRHPYDLRLSDLIGALSSQATNSCPAGRSRRPDHSTGVQLIHHAVVSDLDLAFETVPLAGRSQMLFTYTAEPGFALTVRPSRLLARWAANTDGFEPAARLIPRSRVNRSGGLTDIGNNLKRPDWCSGQREKPVLFGGVTVDISISVDGPASSASPRPPIAQSGRLSGTATFANEWLTKMIKARLHSQQSGSDKGFRSSGGRI
jgi:hypothetical protein